MKEIIKNDQNFIPENNHSNTDSDIKINAEFGKIRVGKFRMSKKPASVRPRRSIAKMRSLRPTLTKATE